MLSEKKIGFIGAGNMGGAIAKGIIASGTVKAENIYLTDKDISKTCDFEKIGCNILPSASDIASACDVVVLAVKPQIIESVLSDVSNFPKPLYISIAAGITIDYIRKFFADDSVRVIRTMPNTPALIGEGVTVISSKTPVSADDIKLATSIFESVGICEVMDEKFLNAVGSVSGSSPAYVYMLIEAMADAAVMDGIPRQSAYKLAAGAVLGAAKMVLETEKHPGELKDNVCSPGGTTIRAVATLEEKGFRDAVISAMKECTKRSNEITK